MFRDELHDETFWKDALVWDMPSFLERYTLHDSQLCEIKLVPILGAILRVQWDLFWNKPIPDGFDELVIRFHDTYWLNWNQGRLDLPTILEANSRIVTTAEREAMMNDGTVDLKCFDFRQETSFDIQPCAFDELLTKTSIECIAGHNISILHGKAIQIVCINEAGERAVVPTEFSDKVN